MPTVGELPFTGPGQENWMPQIAGDGDSGHLGGTRRAPIARSRPCDTCRLRKTRCVKEATEARCVLCAFHDQPCTYLRGPTRRQRKGNQSVEFNDQEPLSRNPGVQPRLDVSNSSPPVLEYEAIGSAQTSPASSHQTNARSPAGSIENNGMSSETSQQLSTELGQARGSTSAPRPRILSNTLGLDLETHAEYIGPTDCRDPILLDLHRVHQGSVEHPSAHRPTISTRRLDSGTAFLIHTDGSTTSESQRIQDLDAIEAAIHPLGRTLVDLYFRVVHPSFPILHKDVFISKHRVSHRHFAPSLLAAVYLVALDWQLYDSSLAGRELESIPNSSALEELAERTMAQDMRRPKLSTLEAGLLLLQRNTRSAETSSHTHPSSSRMFTAQLVAMAQDLGIHIDCTSWDIPSWEVGLRRRLAWALYMQDRWGACAHGRPFLIHELDWDVKTCTDADYPELEDEANTGLSDPSTAAIGWAQFLKHIELTKFLSEVMGTFYNAAVTRSGHNPDRLGTVTIVELAKPLVLRLREWYADLPQHLQMEYTKDRELCANGALRLAHLSVEVALYRALIRAITPETPEQLNSALRSTSRAKVQDAISLLKSLQPEQTAAFWGSAASYQVAQAGSLAALLWATANNSEEMAWCVARVEDLRWALRVRANAAPFAREALRLIERDIGGLGIVAT
ncbi:unnamed protein product [Clonostachys rosea]|uniref:Zn(2)-C6 fungal-type domain-containing protein n=1 Tax=Bionectria ochroleuca TaxID=29856 RepID=A0ABY6U9E9_BIOOC|nr:unnamed protein product [Clonostachys rosea]